jgi:hypothetical protein
MWVIELCRWPKVQGELSTTLQVQGIGLVQKRVANVIQDFLLGDNEEVDVRVHRHAGAPRVTAREGAEEPDLAKIIHERALKKFQEALYARALRISEVDEGIRLVSHGLTPELSRARRSVGLNELVQEQPATTSSRVS